MAPRPTGGTVWFSFVVLCFVLFSVVSPWASSQTVPPGFTIANAFPAASFTTPVQIVFLPDGRKFVVEKAGQVRVLTKTGAQLSTPFIDLSLKVLNNADRGLLGVALDPDFTTNHWVYFLYVVNPDSISGVDGSVSAFSRCERYQISATDTNVADLTSRQILIGGTWPVAIPDPSNDGSHTIGTMRFGTDKTLLIGSGDAANFSVADAGGLSSSAAGFGAGKTDPAQNIGAFRSQSIYNLNGKILRVDKETGFGLPSNPYWDGNPNSWASRVWVYGLRNPYRFALRPGTGSTDPSVGNPGTLYIGDVGWNTYEELNIAHTKGLNFGWPVREGALSQPSYSAVTTTFTGNTNVVASAPLNPENPAVKTEPTLWWHHSNGSLSNPSGYIGNCSIGGVFYTGVTYPPRYRNSYLFADYGNAWIRSAKFDVNDAFIAGSDTILVLNANGPVSLDTDPVSGDLYFVAINTATIYRVQFPTGNHNPVLTASLNPLYGFAPLTVTYNASATDQDNDPLTYKWKFGNGDSSASASGAYAYNVNGVDTVTCTVSDGKGGSAIAVFQVVVGHVPPPGVITSPLDSAQYPADVTVPLSATAADGGQGPVTYSWEVDLLHNDHIHPDAYVSSGQSSSFPMNLPTDGGFYRYRVRLSVTQNSLTSRDTAYVMPASALPIQLTSLSVVQESPLTVRIEWSTLTETDCYGFEIQKSDGGSATYVTVPKSFVPGHGTTLTVQHYAFVDAAAASGNSYYRLKQIDLDGKVHYTPGVKVGNSLQLPESKPTAFVVDQNFPNPFNPVTTIRYALPQTSHIILAVYNTLGQQVAMLVNKEQGAGYHEERFDGSSLASGVYFYRLQAVDPSTGSGSSFVAMKKLLLLR
jgi:glucose/arabinose dehydrogenase